MLERVAQNGVAELKSHLFNQELNVDTRLMKAEALTEYGAELYLTAVGCRPAFENLTLVLARPLFSGFTDVDMGEQTIEPPKIDDGIYVHEIQLQVMQASSMIDNLLDVAQHGRSKITHRRLTTLKTLAQILPKYMRI
ncbi:hypothetical protein F4810DRAFT_721084 [Camillea tinctor]|nr:hypothetical protein F4810DRAFT_721084 [Camillea tinctor]